MSHRVRVLCRPAVAPGFRLAGVDASEARDGESAAAVLSDLRKDPEVGVVLVQDDLHETLPPELLAAMEREALPIVAPFPGPVPEARPTAEGYVVDLLRRAIGYRVKLR